MLKSHVWKGSYLVKMNDLRAYLFVEDKYNGYYNFNRFILAPTVEEINSTSNAGFHVDYIPVKNGSRYDFIKVYFTKRKHGRGRFLYTS